MLSKLSDRVLYLCPHTLYKPVAIDCKNMSAGDADVENGVQKQANHTEEARMDQSNVRFIKGIVLFVVMIVGMFTTFTMYIRAKELQLIQKHPSMFSVSYNV